MPTPATDVDVEYLPANRYEDEFVKAGVHCRTLFQCAWANCTAGGIIALSESADDATYQRNIQAHLESHNKGVRGREPFTCTLDGCSSVIQGAKEFKRHLRSAIHLPYFRHYCPNRGCDRFYSRVDQVKKHLRKCRWSAGGENVPVVTLKRGREEPEDSDHRFVHWNALEHFQGSDKRPTNFVIPRGVFETGWKWAQARAAARLDERELLVLGQAYTLHWAAPVDSKRYQRPLPASQYAHALGNRSTIR
ncbi:hypothetical protein DXG03_005949 [Asterophora parasitica]|uniref:C2H2-type domain-containing protein n=1 Tax=Asterophora parasitica TaxID=117018 RepID=A0A9P7K8H6_9AGAR|nr:hypothetical protein DXG03_005949 [Asterophora parasitica]